MFNSRKIEEIEELERQVTALESDNKRIGDTIGRIGRDCRDHHKKLWKSFWALCKYLNVTYVDECACDGTDPVRRFIPEFDTITTDISTPKANMPNEKLEAIGKEIAEVSGRLFESREQIRFFKSSGIHPTWVHEVQIQIDARIDTLLKLLKERDEIAKT